MVRGKRSEARVDHGLSERLGWESTATQSEPGTTKRPSTPGVATLSLDAKYCPQSAGFVLDGDVRSAGFV